MNFKYLTILLILFFAPITSATAALGVIEQKLRESPEMSSLCIKQLKTNKGRVNYYKDKIAASLAAGKNPPMTDKLKLAHFEAELQNWINYCTIKE